MSDKCLQYKEDYNKLLELKQVFDAALAEGEEKKDFSEVMRLKTQLEKAIIYLERDLKFKVWKTIELGTGLKTAEDFIQALKKDRCEISDKAKFMMAQPEFTALSEKTKFELVLVTVAELGFPKGATLEEIYKRAQEMGLELCPPEVGPQLRLQYKRFEFEWLRIAMDAIKDSGNHSSVFRVGYDNRNFWLGYISGHLGSHWDPEFEWVFVRRKL